MGRLKLKKPRIKVNGVRTYICADCDKVFAVFLDSRIKKIGQKIPVAFTCTNCGGVAVHIPEMGLDVDFKSDKLPKKDVICFVSTSEGPIVKEVHGGRDS